MSLYLFLILMIILIIGVPIVLSYFIYRWISKTEFRKYALIFPTLILGTLIFFIYTAFYPTDSLYLEDFQLNTNIKLPETAKIISKDASYPDQFGDYWVSAIIELNEDEYLKLQLELSKSKSFAIDTTKQKIGITKEYNKLTENVSQNEIEIVYYNKNEQWFKVAFLKDKKRIIFERSSS